jgi:hypothetical protein
MEHLPSFRLGGLSCQNHEDDKSKLTPNPDLSSVLTPQGVMTSLTLHRTQSSAVVDLCDGIFNFSGATLEDYRWSFSMINRFDRHSWADGTSQSLLRGGKIITREHGDVFQECLSIGQITPMRPDFLVGGLSPFGNTCPLRGAEEAFANLATDPTRDLWNFAWSQAWRSNAGTSLLVLIRLGFHPTNHRPLVGPKWFTCWFEGQLGFRTLIRERNFACSQAGPGEVTHWEVSQVGSPIRGVSASSSAMSMME